MKTRASMSAMLHLPADVDVKVRFDEDGVTVHTTGAIGTGDCYTGVTMFFPSTDAFDTWLLTLCDQQARRMAR